jgi:hypothetical protein
VDEPLAELAGYFRTKSRVPDPDLVRLTDAAREGGSRWDAIAVGCGVRDYHDITGVAALPCWKADDTGAELLFCATQYAVEQLTGGQRRFPPLTWVCPGRGQQVTDRAPTGRQAAEDQRRRDQDPGLILHSEPAAGPVQRHWLRSRSLTTARAAAGAGTFITTWPPSTATGPPRSATTATATYTRASPLR